MDILKVVFYKEQNKVTVWHEEGMIEMTKDEVKDFVNDLNAAIEEAEHHEDPAYGVITP